MREGEVKHYTAPSPSFSLSSFLPSLALTLGLLSAAIQFPKRGGAFVIQSGVKMMGFFPMQASKQARIPNRFQRAG